MDNKKLNDFILYRMNPICIKIAIIFAILTIAAIAALVIDANFVDHRVSWLVYDETGMEWTGDYIKLPPEYEFSSGCRLWPETKPLELSGKYWIFGDQFDRWIRCD